MSNDLRTAQELAQAGDVAGLMRHLRFTADRLAVGDVAPLAGRAAELMGFTDLAEAARAVAAAPDDADALYGFGYACIERGASYLAVPALEAALARRPGALEIVRELVVALEDEHRHGDAVTVLDGHREELLPWPDRYLLSYNALMAGDLARAAAEFAELPTPGHEQWLPARDRLSRMIERARAAQAVGPLDHRDLRGWHFALSGGVLATLSPYGFDQGMTGRYAYLRDDFGMCLRGLLRLRVILEAAGRGPRTVSLLPGRGDRALGLAAARVLGLPAEPYAPGRTDTVVIAYDLREADDELLAGLHERLPGQVVYEHATCWTEPPAISADVSTLLAQTVTPPWGEQLQVRDGSVERSPADDRGAEELAEEILRADPAPDGGDGATPPDDDEVLARFVAGVAALWPAGGPRDRVRSPGPVRSSRFA
ncbi:hypothetical protein [Thermoactinospora rubra]|uniref:hypothetical protein n=1 Tax=Thermoactinospora rubra TaxID=1088767 RepID=UPI000A0FD4DE|nr:hypothetical protein [Thermoactinospora rubra]